MTSFWVKLTSFLVVVASLFMYNNVVNDREQSEKIAELEYKIEQKANAADNSEATSSNYKDGKYTGEADGFGGTIKVEIEIKDGAINSIDILSAENEDGVYLDMAKAIIDDILSEQSSDVDTVSGATFSSTGIKNAVIEALGKAE